MSRAIVVTGTDTGVGKTVVAAALAGTLGGRYWKPVQAGLADGEDSLCVAALSGLPPDHILAPAYRLKSPCSPHRAAEIDQVTIKAPRLALPDVCAPLIVEGSGGVLVPLTRKFLMIDLFARWGAPVVLVARTSLGTINHSLLSLEALRSRKIPVLGVVFVGPENEDSEQTICSIGGARRLGRLPWIEPLDRGRLLATFDRTFSAGDFIL